MPIDQYTLNYLNQLNDYIRSLHNRLYETENRLRVIEEDYNAFKNDPKMHVDRIEYKFDQLKIERLDGTLNIGLTPKTGENLLEDLAEDGQLLRSHNQSEGIPNSLITEINEHISVFLKNGLLEEIKALEQKHHFPLNDHYRLFIIEDIQKQIPNKVIQLIQTMNQDQDQRQLLTSEPERVEEYIFETIKHDILTGIDQFILKLKNGGELV